MILKGKAKCPHCDGYGQVEVVVPHTLRMHRIFAGVSLRAFAKQLGMSAPYLGDIERGRRNCTDEIFIAYSKLKPKKQKNEH